MRRNDHVILVDKDDNALGIMPKMEAHEKGVLHRAFSIFILNDKDEVMLQKRALHKYHSPGLWSNTCCSHQQNGETSLEAGQRRLDEEMGFNTELKEMFTFIYKAPFSNGLTEHELDHVIIGRYEADPVINPEEVADWKWIDIHVLADDIEAQPDKYTEWFKIVFSAFKEQYHDFV